MRNLVAGSGITPPTTTRCLAGLVKIDIIAARFASVCVKTNEYSSVMGNLLGIEFSTLTPMDCTGSVDVF